MSDTVLLATVGLTPLPSEKPFVTSSVENQNILCYGAFKINFVPPFTQYGVANASINASTSLAKISAVDLYQGTLFKNQIVMAPVLATTTYTEGVLYLTIEYPNKDEILYPGYNPFPPLQLDSRGADKVVSSLAYPVYTISKNLNFYFPAITDKKPVSVESINLISNDKNTNVYFAIYSTTLTTDVSGVVAYTFAQVSLDTISNWDSKLNYPLTYVFMQNINLPINTTSINFFLDSPQVLNQSTIPESDFEKFLNQVYTALSPLAPGIKLLGVLYFDRFQTNGLPWKQNSVIGQTIVNTNASDYPTSSVCTRTCS